MYINMTNLILKKFFIPNFPKSFIRIRYFILKALINIIFTAVVIHMYVHLLYDIFINKHQ